MSKSLGNGVDPVDIANRMGGEIVRLWVASVDFREDMAASENLMQRCAELYRKLRNTFRFLLGNLAGFDPGGAIALPEAELLPLDRYMLARTRDLTEKILGWYERFEFHRVYQAVNEFAIVDLSSFYLDVLKDRMYTFAPTEPRAPLGANRAVADHRSAGAAGRADPELHRRRSLGVSARRRRPRSKRAPGAVSQTGRDLLRRSRRPCSQSGSSSSRCATQRLRSA